ncbi:MAG: hypothetical protein JRJ43_05855 [Deltaproteobacteria bacterium]|nr:hypothetical protein [Deltaproteobacteria bacterium]
MGWKIEATPQIGFFPVEPTNAIAFQLSIAPSEHTLYSVFAENLQCKDKPETSRF